MSDMLVVQRAAVARAHALVGDALKLMQSFETRTLESDTAKLQARIIELEQALGLTAKFPSLSHIKPMQRKLFGLLVSRPFVSWEAAFLALYEPSAGRSLPDRKVLHVHVCELRKELDKHGIVISTVVGEGVFMRPEMQEKSKAVVAA
jgi:DNA-binding response OmpR family regulator